MLFKAHGRLPPEALGQAFRVDIVSARELKISKQSLQLIRDAVLLSSVQVLIVLPREDELPELRGHVQRLKETVHVASGALVCQTNIFMFSLLSSQGVQGICHARCISLIVKVLSAVAYGRASTASSRRSLIEHKSHYF
jgi:hypothetical protein